MGKNILKTLGVSLLTGVMVLSCTVPTLASSLAVKNDLNDADIIDVSKKGSVSIYKYDITSAEAAGAYKAGDHDATGEADLDLQKKLEKYAVEGVEFTYLRCGDIETYSYGRGSKVAVVYEIPNELKEILHMDAADALNMSGDNIANPCEHTGVSHYTSQQLNDALKELLEADNVEAKNAIEAYVTSNSKAVSMKLTDQNGFTEATDLDLGLYLIAETKVPEQVVASCNPWFISLPFTNEAGNWNDSEGGQRWLYDMTCYPKNQTGNPTLDKLVRNAHGEAADAAGKYEDGSYLVYSKEDEAAEHTNTDQAYIDARDEYQYASTGTASEGDILDYILVSKLPHITSSATYLTEYTFRDVLSKGLTYNKDVKIAFYHSAEDANINNTANADVIWTDDTFTQGYADVTAADDKQTGGTVLTVKMTEKGLSAINDPVHGFSDYYMVVYYTVTVNSDASVILGDEGNPNDFTLTWKRTSDNYYNTLEDKCKIYTFGLNLTKTFSDEKGDPTKVQFKLYNATDAYYVAATEAESGVYYVTGKTVSKEEATIFSPSSSGKLQVNGIEGDTYQLTEIATDHGYSLLKDQITISIQSTSETIIPSVAGTTGLESATAAGQEINHHYAGGIVDATGANVSDSKGEQASETADGRTIGKTAMYEGELIAAAASVDHVKAVMSEMNGSKNANVDISILNSKTFLLPQTGGAGLYVVTILGVLAIAIGGAMTRRQRKDA